MKTIYHNKMLDSGANCSYFKDLRDQHKYIIVTIGTQTWMAENLAYLPFTRSINDLSDISPIYCVLDYNGNSVSEAKATDQYNTYGVLYNWEAAIEACPPGWHIPMVEEWQTLIDFIEIHDVDAGNMLKSKFHWAKGSKGIDSYGFNALPVGNFGHTADFWTSSPRKSSLAWYTYLYYSYGGVGLNYCERSRFRSVRCLQD